jgi:penicillin-binding protein 1A
LDVTPEKVARIARRMGVRSQLDIGGDYVPAMGLGSIAVSPLDLASGYATLASGGVYAEPMAIRRVVLANGKEDRRAGWGRPKRRRAMSEGAAAVVTRILEQNMQSGTGTRAAFGRPAAGKTGTNEEHKDAWFAGYTPDLATTVWIGYTRAEIPMESVHGIAVSGGSFPAEIWRLFMEPALETVEPTPFAEPAYWPEWQPFERGRYALTYDPYYTPPASEEEEEEKEKGDEEGDSEKPADEPTEPKAPRAGGDDG